MNSSTLALFNLINSASIDVSEKSAFFVEESETAAPIHTIHRQADLFYPSAIAIPATSATPNPFESSTDSFVLKIGGSEILQLPLSLLYKDSGSVTFVPSSGKYYLQFDIRKWIHEIPLLYLAFHEVKCFLRSGTVFFLQSCFKLMNTTERRALADKISPPGQSIFYQSPVTYKMPADRLTVPQMEARPEFSGYSKGFLIDACIDQLRSLQIMFEFGKHNYRCIYSPDQLTTQCYKLSDKYLWIPMNPDTKTPFSKDCESFIGALNQNFFKIKFLFEFDSVQENLCIHSIQYNILKYESGMADCKYTMPFEVSDYS